MQPNTASQFSDSAIPDEIECPLCDGNSIETFEHLDSFIYGSGRNAVKLQVTLPVRRCTDCRFEFVDEEGESLRHDEVCRHLGVLAPSQVRKVRQQYGMTRSAFAEVSALGEATLNRWENGAVIQNRAYDLYLRLLRSPWIMSALREHVIPETRHRRRVDVSDKQFRMLEVSEDLNSKAKNFQLRPAA